MMTVTEPAKKRGDGIRALIVSLIRWLIVPDATVRCVGTIGDVALTGMDPFALNTGVLSAKFTATVESASTMHPISNPDEIAFNEINGGEEFMDECNSNETGAQWTSSVGWVDPVQWLAERRIQVNWVPARKGFDPAADRLALFLGEHFPSLEKFYRALKRATNNSQSGRMSLHGLSQTTVDCILQFGNMTHRCTFLSQFEYRKGDQVILFRLMEDGRVLNFFTGNWLERYVLQVIKQTVERWAGSWNDKQALTGARVTLPDNGESEIDLLVSLPNHKVLWFECKTGEWQSHVMRLRHLRRLLQIPSQKAILVLLDELDDVEKACVSTLINMTVLHPTDLSAWLDATFIALLSQDAVQENIRAGEGHPLHGYRGNLAPIEIRESVSVPQGGGLNASPAVWFLGPLVHQH